MNSVATVLWTVNSTNNLNSTPMQDPHQNHPTKSKLGIDKYDVSCFPYNSISKHWFDFRIIFCSHSNFFTFTSIWIYTFGIGTKSQRWFSVCKRGIFHYFMSLHKRNFRRLVYKFPWNYFWLFGNYQENLLLGFYIVFKSCHF